MAGESKGSFFEGTPGNRSSGDGVGPVAQRIRARGYEPRCRGFESLLAHNRPKRPNKGRAFPSGGRKIMIGIAYQKLWNLGMQAQFPAASTVVAQTPQMQYRSANVPFYGAPVMYPALVSYATILLQAFHTMTPRDPSWNMNTGASSHLADNAVRQFTRDNDVSVELDAYDFLVKDYQTGRLLLRCDSTGDLYPVTQQPSSQTPVVLLSFSSTTWYRRIGHPGDDVLRRLESRNLISCRKSKLSALCHACQLGKHAKLLFYNFETSVDSVFEIIHSDIWTSPIPNESGIKYYAIFLDQFSHFCDHGGEYDNTRFHDLFRQNGIQFWFSCPRTSQQNGKSERLLRTINNLIRTLLFQDRIPPSYWVEALNMAAHLLNILPSTAINNEIPYTKLYNQTPTYEHLRVFGCLCYPHVDVSHKLEPRSTPCIFLGYPTNHRGYRCLDLASNKIIISRHVRFDEDVFPFGNVTSSNKPTYDFLLPPIQTTTNVPTTEPFVQHMDELNNPITPHPTTPPSSPPQPDTPPSHSSTPIPPQTNTHPSHNSTPILTLAQTQSHAQTVDSHTPIPINNSSQTMSTHPMVTRAKAGIFKPLERMNYHVTTTSPLPRSHVHTIRDPNRKETMLDEYNALITNGTWVLVPRPTNVNVVRSMWLFKHKFNADGSLSRYKARLVANGRSQQQGIDCDETFSLVVKPATIRTVLSLAVSRDWPIHQLDVKNAFLHGHLSETVYMHQPPGFVDPNKPDYHSKTDSSLFVFHRESDIAYLLLYVDDIILTPSSSAFLHQIIASLPSEFAMKDLGSLNYFLGISAQRSTSGLFLSLSKFAKKILERAYMQHCNPCRTPMDTESMLGSNGDPISDPTLYRSLAGALQYLTFTHLDISYVVQHELHAPLTTTTLVYCDNVRVLHVPSQFQYADIFTKGLLSALFCDFRSSLNVQSPPVTIVGEY
ncbi:ribonuclease H-like domain-containing protein [Tanacetum coccineum]